MIAIMIVIAIMIMVIIVIIVLILIIVLTIINVVIITITLKISGFHLIRLASLVQSTHGAEAARSRKWHARCLRETDPQKSRP